MFSWHHSLCLEYECLDHLHLPLCLRHLLPPPSAWNRSHITQCSTGVCCMEATHILTAVLLQWDEHLHVFCCLLITASHFIVG